MYIVYIYIYIPLKIHILHIIPWRFAFWSCSFLFMGDGCSCWSGKGCINLNHFSNLSSWWLFPHPSEKYSSNSIMKPQGSGWNLKKYLQLPPPSTLFPSRSMMFLLIYFLPQNFSIRMATQPLPLLQRLIAISRGCSCEWQLPAQGFRHRQKLSLNLRKNTTWREKRWQNDQKHHIVFKKKRSQTPVFFFALL